MAYVTAIRVLSQKHITDRDVLTAELLLSYFCREFVNFYGEKNLLFNVHLHLHFASQAHRFGPLNKLNCFSFEGMIRICKESVHGTRGFLSQVNKFLSVNRFLESDCAETFDALTSTRLSSFLYAVKTRSGPKYKHTSKCLIKNLESIHLIECLLESGLSKNDECDISHKYFSKNIRMFFFFILLFFIKIYFSL